MILKHIYRSDRWPQFRTGCRSGGDCLRLLNYLFRPAAEPKVLRNDFAGSSPREVADELEALHRGQRLWAYHVVASYPKDEADRWEPQAVGRIEELQGRLGIEKGIWVRHSGHWHGLLMSMTPTGGTIRLGTADQDGEPIPVASAFRRMAEKWEDETPGAQKTGRERAGMSLSRDAIAMAERQYLACEEPTPVPKKLLLRVRIDRLVALSRSLDELRQNAELAGVEVRFRRDADGRAVGVSFSHDGVSLRGREAGYSLPQLRSLYEHDTTIADLRGHARMAERAGPTNRRQSDGRSPAGIDQADTDPGGDPRSANGAVGQSPGRIGWADKAFRALAPGNSLLDLLLGLSWCLTRVCNQNDFRRRTPKPSISL